MGKSVGGRKQCTVRFMAQHILHDLVAIGRGDVGGIGDKQMQAAGSKWSVPHIGQQATQAVRHPIPVGITPGDGQSCRADVQKQALPTGTLAKERDADAT